MCQRSELIARPLIIWSAKFFSGVWRNSHSWFEEYLKIIGIGDYFFEWPFIFRVFHLFYMPGSHPLWATFVWPIEIRVHCKNQSSSVSRVRDRDHNESRSWRGTVHTQASLRKHVISLDRVRHLISGVDHRVKQQKRGCAAQHENLYRSRVYSASVPTSVPVLNFQCAYVK